MKKLLTHTLFYTGLLSGQLMNGQTAIQQVTVTDNGPADTLGVVRLTRNSNNNLIITGNNSINATQCNFQTLCYDPSGNQTWAQMYNTNMQKAYSTAATHDSNDNIIVVGCSYVNATNLQDLTVLKYSPGGTLLWQRTFNGGADDVAADVVVDNNNNIYVTGYKGGTGLNVADYVTLKYNSSGTLQWTATYDYSGFVDVPTKITFNQSTGLVTVSGCSGSSLVNFDIATLQYNASSGAQQGSTYRQSSSTVAQNLQSDLVQDNSGNIYYTGRMWNGNSFDILLSKFDHNMNALWSVSYDGFGLDDGGSRIAWDNNSSSIIIAGYVTKPGATQHETMVLKYDANGNLQYKYPQDINKLPGNSEGLGLKIAATGEIYVGGNSTINGNKDAFLLKLTSKCQPLFYDAFNNSGTNEDQFFDLLIDQGNILMSTRSVVSSQYRNLVVHYAERNITPTFVGSNPIYVANQQIMSFNPAVMKMSAINNRKFIFGQLSDFVADSVCDRISSKLTNDAQKFDAKQFSARKIFLTMTQKDSLSKTRLGDVIKVPKFYATILVDIPTLAAPQTLQGISNSLNNIKPCIYYSEFNHGMKICSAQNPNDLYWFQQPNLHHWNNSLPVADINVDTCWAVAQGDPGIKVGVFDSGMENSHEDLDSIPTQGYDFTSTGGGLATNNDYNGHGTQITGIIAATKNNTHGIAGIAGRDDSTHTQGVTLANCKVLGFDSNGYDSLISISTAAFAMHHAVRGDSTGFAINVANHSFAYGGNNGDSLFKNRTFQDQLIFACRNGVAVAGAKTAFGNLASGAFPADWNPEINSSVGGSGNNGERSRSSGPGANANGTTNFGYNLDFLAPCDAAMIKSTDIGNDYNNPSLGSAACAHVSGAYALMMSYFNTVFDPWGHLLHEDCENILKRTCTDLNSPLSYYNESPGYDIYSGYGRINVSRAIREINKYHFRFRHINTTHASNFSISSALLNSNVSIQWPAVNNVAAGTYQTNVFEVTTTLHYNLTPTETIIDKWPMYKECFGWPDDVTNLRVDKPYFSKIVSANNTTAVLKTYAYFNQTSQTWYPFDPNAFGQVRSAITLYTYDTQHTGVGIQENLNPNVNFRLRPNPNNGQFTVTFGAQEENNLHYRVVDLLGKELISEQYQSHYGINNIPVDLSAFSNGIYILNVLQGNQVLYKQKVIKN